METQVIVEFLLKKTEGVDYYNIKTIVKDADTSAPISGAKVVVSKMIQELQSGLTGSDGICVLGPFVAASNYTISVEKVGYDKQIKGTNLPPN